MLRSTTNVAQPLFYLIKLLLGDDLVAVAIAQLKKQL